MRAQIAGGFAMLVISTAAQATITKVQTVTASDMTTHPAGTTLTTGSFSLTSGNLLVVFARTDATYCTTHSQFVVSDAAGNTFTLIARADLDANNTSAMWYAKNVTGSGSETITVRWQSGGVCSGNALNYVAIVAIEYSGADTTAPFDVGTTCIAANATYCTTGSISTSYVNEMHVYAASVDAVSQSFTASLVAGSTATIQITDSSPTTALEDNLVYATGSRTARMNVGTSRYWEAVFATFRPQQVESAVRLKTFDGFRRGDSVGLRWKTGFEVDNLGFNLFKVEGGKSILLTPAMQVGSALLAGPGTPLISGNSYYWQDDASPSLSAQYWLEEIDLSGASTWHGPVTPVFSLAAPAASQMAESLASTGTRAERAQGSSDSRKSRQPLAGEVWAKLSVDAEGWYRVSFAELAAAGFSVAAPSSLSLSAEGVDQPLAVNADGVEFYGVPRESPYGAERVYWLAPTGAASRVATAEASKPAGTPGSSFPFEVKRSDKSIYFAALKNGEAENFFGSFVQATPTTQILSVKKLAEPAALLDVSLQGVTFLSHQVEIQFNGAVVGVVSFEGQARGSFHVPVSALEGDNSVTLVARGEGKDVSLIDSVKLTYAHRYETDGDFLNFTIPAGQAARLTGFGNSGVRVIDVTEPTHLVEMTGAVGIGKAVELGASPNARTLLAFLPQAVRKPARLEARSAPDMKATGAELVIVSHALFSDPIARLAQERIRQGLSVQVAEADDVYDAFGYGEKSPGAIKAFLQTAYQAGTRYALLVGDASFDPKNHLGFGDLDFMPTGVVESTHLETASDDALADFDGDGVPELMVGRLPVRTADEANIVVEKIVSYRSQPRSLVALTGPTGDANFAHENESLLRALPEDVSIQKLSSDELGLSEARRELLALLAAGAPLVEYLGHGSTEEWADILERADIPRMKTVGALPFVVSLTCLNGYFHDVYTESLGESLLKAPGGGAVAVYATSALSTATEQVEMGKELVAALLRDSATLGESAHAAKMAQKGSGATGSWLLLGDPTLRIFTAQLEGSETPHQAPSSGARGCGCDGSGAPMLLAIAVLGASMLRRFKMV